MMEKDDVSTAQSKAPSSDGPKFFTLCPICRVRYKFYRNLLNKPTRCQSCSAKFFASEETSQTTKEKRALSENHTLRSNSVASKPTNQLQPRKPQPQTVPLSSPPPRFSTICPFCKFRYGCPRTYINKEITCRQGQCKQRFIAAEMNVSSLQRKEIPSKNPGTHFSGKGSSTGLSGDLSVGEKRKRNEYGESCNAGNRGVVDNNRRFFIGDRDAQVGAAVWNSRDLEVDKNIEDVIDNIRGGISGHGDERRQEEELERGRQLHEVDRSGETLPNVMHTNQELHEEQDDLGSFRNLEMDKNSGSCDSGSRVVRLSECTGPKFNNFDKLREEVEFRPFQAWALYDTADGMPRQYAQIRKVSAPGFGVRFTYLEPEPIDEKEIQWFEEDLPVSTGNFRLGKNENTKDRSIFSHVTRYYDGSKRGHYTVSPRKGETWALFKNWDINWSLEPDSHRKYEYEFVEILSDYDDKAGVSVAFLYKAKGFASVFFGMGTGNADIFRIKPQSLYRFSHRIHSIQKKRVDIKGVPKDAYELDQASLPETIEERIVPSHLLAEPKQDIVAFPINEKGFKTGQIWSFYSGSDELPLYYCRIQRITVYQGNEEEAVFKLHVSRFKATSFPENVIQWKKMPVGCGTFLVAPAVVILAPDHVSHQIVPEISWDGNEYTILPKIGEVWAVYRVWTSQKEFKDVGHCDYDIVEVLDDTTDYKVLALEPALFYNEVEETKTFFRGAESRHPDCDDEDGSEVTFTIPKSKMLRFSYQIPAYRVTKEINGDMKEVFEVDSRAVPANVRSQDH